MRGFTMIELAVTIVVVALLAAIAMPYLGKSISTSRTRTLIAKFTQDFAWLRNAASTSSSVVTLTLNANCSWSGVVDSTADSSHSMSLTQINNSSAGLSCAGQSQALPITFTFSRQGFVSPAATFTFTASTSQQWPVQVLGSGTVAITTGGS